MIRVGDIVRLRTDIKPFQLVELMCGSLKGRMGEEQQYVQHMIRHIGKHAKKGTRFDVLVACGDEPNWIGVAIGDEFDFCYLADLFHTDVKAKGMSR